MYTRGRARGRARGGTRGGARGGTRGASDSVEADLQVAAATPRPQRTNANNHPGKVVNDAKQVRRTPKEVTEAKEKAAAAKLAAIQDKKIQEHNTVQHLASIEDQARQEDTDYEKNALRPDLRVAKKAKIVYS